MLPDTQIQQYGGKAAILMYVKEKLPHMPIPQFVVKEHSHSIGTVMDDFRSMKTPVIVRSSSPYEYEDFEGIFDSVRDVEGKGSLERAIEEVERSSISERAILYAQQNGFNIDERIHTMVQEQSDSNYSGAMMRHPNNPDLIFIAYFSGRGKYSKKYSTFLFNEKTRTSQENGVFYSHSDAKKFSEFLVEKYHEIESIEEISDGKVLYVEFGLEPFVLYQIRPFKEIKTADFEMPQFKDKGQSIFKTDLSFGITPPEGVVYPVLRNVGFSEAKLICHDMEGLLGINKPSILEFGHHDGVLRHNLINGGPYSGMVGKQEFYEFLNEILKGQNETLNELLGQSYCYMTSSANREDYDVDLSVPNMKSLMIGGMEFFLVHGLIRLVKKADVTVAESYLGLLNNELFKTTKSVEDKVRIFSNGKEAVVIKE